MIWFESKTNDSAFRILEGKKITRVLSTRIKNGVTTEYELLIWKLVTCITTRELESLRRKYQSLKGRNEDCLLEFRIHRGRKRETLNLGLELVEETKPIGRKFRDNAYQ